MLSLLTDDRGDKGSEVKQIEWAFLFFKLRQLNCHSATDETLNVMSNDMYAVEKAGRKNRSVACNTSSFPLPTRYSRDVKITLPFQEPRRA